jgi:phospholipase/lecithinase/hemolysin
MSASFTLLDSKNLHQPRHFAQPLQYQFRCRQPFANRLRPKVVQANQQRILAKDTTMRLGTFLLVAAVCAAPCDLAFASSFSGIVSFGDSLSDPGNASIGTGGADPGPGYATRTVPGVPFPVGYYTNPQSGSGPTGLWVDQLAATLGVADPEPFLAPGGGTNFAVASSFTAGYNGLAPGMDAQVADFLTAVAGSAPASALYTFWGGANDIFDAATSPVTAANNIESEIEAVAAAGGKTFLWLNLPPLGETPALNGDPGLAALANAETAAFDAQWATDVSTLDGLGIDVVGVNVDNLFNSVTSNPSAYGLTDVTDACDATAGCNPNTFLYWDSEHPTTEADSLIASLAAQDLAPTPEPPSIALLTLGGVFALGLGYARRRKMASTPKPAFETC